ncbi:MAG: hypothetical protein KDD53_03375 [Bdellovibrionales bacterium]|nr:hypothetical protein [Bdellovibrionales bacterium]
MGSRGRGGFSGRGGRGRGGHRDNRGGGRGGRDNRGRGGRGGRGGRDLREASISGNKRERISVESGELVFIDQFMLANPQFVDSMIQNVDADSSVKDSIIQNYGGAVVKMDSGTYRIDRDPFALYIVVYPDGERIESEGITDRPADSLGRVFIDTRCLAMIDKELLDDSDLLLKYQETWFRGDEKACRDLLRDNGGAVRYGFSRFGDELGIYRLSEEGYICLWPDVTEPELEAEVAQAEAS